MLKTIFRKQIVAYLSALIISFVFLGIVLSSVFSSYLVNQKRVLLTEQCERIAQIYTQYQFLYAENFSDRTLQIERVNMRTRLSKELDSMQMYMNANCFFTDKNMKVVLPSEEIDFLYGEKITEETLKTVLQREIPIYRGTLSGYFTDTQMIIGYPIIVGENVVGAAFVSAPMDDVNKTIKDMIVMTLLTLTVSAVVAFIMVYAMSMTITKPILKMNEHAKVIASGDFEKRLYVKSNDEVGQLAESFNNMAESLQNQEETRRAFISNISHDLRSPLTSMTGFLKAILDGTVPPEKQNHYLAIVLDESERLSNLANDLLDLNKIRTLDIELDISRFDLNELIRKTVLMFENRVTEKNINMVVNFANNTDYVRADYDKIQRVVYNLMDNAVKFSRENGEISVETTDVDGAISVSVKDNGIGIKKEDQKKIFDRFYKGDTSRGEYTKGSGLGLSIVREFIKAHGGQLRVISELDKGSEFIFTLKSEDQQ